MPNQTPIQILIESLQSANLATPELIKVIESSLPYERIALQDAMRFGQDFPSVDATEWFDKRYYAPRYFYIKIQANHDCWLAEGQGDPARTLILENAKKFHHKDAADYACKEMSVKYPNRAFKVEEL